MKLSQSDHDAGLFFPAGVPILGRNTHSSKLLVYTTSPTQDLACLLLLLPSFLGLLFVCLFVVAAAPSVAVEFGFILFHHLNDANNFSSTSTTKATFLLKSVGNSG